MMGLGIFSTQHYGLLNSPQITQFFTKTIFKSSNQLPQLPRFPQLSLGQLNNSTTQQLNNSTKQQLNKAPIFFPPLANHHICQLANYHSLHFPTSVSFIKFPFMTSKNSSLLIVSAPRLKI